MNFLTIVENFLDSRVIKVGLVVSDCETHLVSRPNFKFRYMEDKMVFKLTLGGYGIKLIYI